MRKGIKISMGLGLLKKSGNLVLNQWAKADPWALIEHWLKASQVEGL